MQPKDTVQYGYLQSMKTNQIVIAKRNYEWPLPEYVLGLLEHDCMGHTEGQYHIYLFICFNKPIIYDQ